MSPTQRRAATALVASGLKRAEVPLADAQAYVTTIAQYGGPLELAELADIVAEVYAGIGADHVPTLREEFARS